MPSAPRYKRFRPPDQPEDKLWLVFEAAGGKWLLFLHPTAPQRRLAPAPPGWQELGPAELNALLTLATPAPTGPFWPRARARRADKNVPREQDTARLTSAALLMEHEKRVTAEEQLREALAALREMERDLASANSELRTMNEELLEMAQALADQARQSSPSPPRTHHPKNKTADPGNPNRPRI